MKMKLSKNSWHFKLNKYMKRDVDGAVDFCSYFWKTVTSFLGAPFLVVFFFLANTYTAIEKKIRSFELNRASKMDILSSYVHYRKDKSVNKHNTILWISYVKSMTGKSVWGFIPDSSPELAALVDDFNANPTIYTKGTLYRMLEKFAGALFFMTAVFYVICVATTVIYYFKFADSKTLGLLDFYLVTAKILINGFIGVVFVICVEFGVNYYKTVKKKKTDKPEKQKNRNNPVEFVKAGYTSFKEKTCHKIEWET